MISRFFDLIFSGSRQQKQLEADNPVRETAVPDFDKDIPQVLKSEKASGDVIHRYQQLRDNLLERHENYEKVLKGYLKPEEAIDIYKRLEEIDAALLEAERNLQRAMDAKNRPTDEPAKTEDLRRRLADMTQEEAKRALDALENMRDNPPEDLVELRMRAARERMRNRF